MLCETLANPSLIYLLLYNILDDYPLRYHSFVINKGWRTEMHHGCSSISGLRIATFLDPTRLGSNTSLPPQQSIGTALQLAIPSVRY